MLMLSNGTKLTNSTLKIYECYNLNRVKIVFTKHAEKKFKDLAILGVKASKKAVIDIVDNPVHKDVKSDYPNTIVSGNFDKARILRVVYRVERGKILIITFYPAKKGRYY